MAQFPPKYHVICMNMHLLSNITVFTTDNIELTDMGGIMYSGLRKKVSNLDTYKL